MALAFYLYLKHELPKTKIIYWPAGGYGALLLMQLIIYTYAQYIAWLENPVSRYLLPPYQSLDYFAGYIWFHYGLPLAVNLAAAVVWWGILIILKRRSQGLWLDNSEAALGFLTAWLVGWPNILMYWAIMFSLMVLRLAVANIKKQVDFRLAVTWPMIIATLVSLALGGWLLQSVGLDVLKVVG